MTKAELKEVLSVYPQIRTAVLKGERQTAVKKYRQQKNMEISDWIRGLEANFRILIENEDVLIVEIIKKSYFLGQKDREIIMNLPVTDCGYYRIKKSIEDKLYNMLIADGFVKKEEITENKL